MKTISINRAPVLTLWAAVDAQRLGFAADEALTLCKALAVTPDAFTQEPAARPEAKRGRPRKESGEAAPSGKKAKTTARKRKASS